MHHWLKIFLLFGSLLISSCASGKVLTQSEKRAPDIDHHPTEIQTRLRRETKGLALHSTKGDLTLDILSSEAALVKLTERPLKQYSIAIGLGASENLNCLITEKVTFPGLLIKALIDEISGSPEIKSSNLEFLDANLLKETPYLYAELGYTTNSAGYRQVKIFSTLIDKLSLLCSHNEPGYRETFFRVIESLLTNDFIKKHQEQHDGNYKSKQIDIVYLNGRPGGYTESLTYHPDQLRTHQVVFTTMLLPQGDRLNSSGVLRGIVFNRSDGQLLSGRYSSFQNGQEQYGLRLERDENRLNYRVSGSFRGKSIKRNFTTNEALLTSDHLIYSFINSTQAAGSKLDFLQYTPLTPLKPTSATIHLVNRNKDNTSSIEYTLNSMNFTIELDENSHLTINYHVGPLRLELRRRFYKPK